MSSFTMTTHQIWSCHVALAANFENCYLSPNSMLSFRKSYQIWEKLAQEQRVTSKKQNSGWKPPSAYRIKNGLNEAADQVYSVCGHQKQNFCSHDRHNTRVMKYFVFTMT